MRFVPEFAADARSQWLDLDFDSQECVFDALEGLVNDPPNVSCIRVADEVHDAGSTRHYVFVTLCVDVDRRRVTVLGIGHFSRPLPT